MDLKSRLPALQSSDYRIWFFGQGVSVIGTWLQNTGQAWLVLKLTNSPLLLGVLTSIQYLPSLLLSVFIGPVIDLFPKRTILIWTQSLFAITAAIMAWVAFGGHAQYWQVLVISAATGIITAVDWPARQSFVSEQVHDRLAVVNAVALNSLIFNIARIIGPALGGILISAVGIPWTFALNAVSFLAVIVGLLFMKAGRVPSKTNSGDYFSDMKAGISYIRHNATILSLLVLIGVVSLFLLNFNVLIPSFAKLSLGLTASGYGGLMSAMGVGAMAAGMLMSLGGRRLEPKPAYIYGAGFILSSSMILLGLQHSVILSGLLIMLCGFGMSAFATMCNTSVQMQASDDMRGRVMFAYNLVFVGSTPIGSLYVGQISDTFGSNMGFLLSGIIGVVFLLAMRMFVTPNAFKGIQTFARARTVEDDMVVEEKQ